MMGRIRTVLLLAIFLIKVSSVFSQNPNIKRTWHWFFGNHAGIDFSSGTAVADTNGALVTSEGCATISDTSGNLLFYSDGRTVWNRLHQVMPNGTGLMGGANGSSTQQALIIPKPLTPNLYYLFTTDEAQNYGANGLRYSIIDMNLDGGYGDINSIEKNILLFSPCTEKLAAINHCNDTDIWIMGHEINNNNFRVYLLGSDGIDSNAVVSSVGYPHNANVFLGIAGSAKFSPNAKKICTATDTSLRRIELFDFDNYSGAVENAITISQIDSISHAISFSPDNSKLYIGRYSSGLFQFDVSSNDSTTIVDSRTLIYSFPNGFPGFRYMENGPDGYIYIIHSLQGDSMISKIENPNSVGLACNLNLFSINLNKPSTLSGLPNFNQSYFNQNVGMPCLTSSNYLEDIHNVNIIPNPARDWIILEGNGILSIEISNALGAIEYYSATTSALRHQIDVKKFSPGIYFIRINKIFNKRVCGTVLIQ